MCSVSKIDGMLGVTGNSGTAAAAAAAPMISSTKLKHSPEKYFLVDIREDDEIESEPLPDDVNIDAKVPMGRLFSHSDTDEYSEWKTNGKTIVLVCNTGYRASITASELIKNGFNAVSLMRGLIGLRNPAATIPDLVVVLGTKSNAEKLTLAVNACAAASSQGETVVLGLMGDGVCTFLRKGSNIEEASSTSFRVTEVFVGEPFKPCDILLNKFLGTGNGLVLACTSCVKNRGIEFGSHLLDCVQPMQMPDLLRMLGEAKNSLQFL